MEALKNRCLYLATIQNKNNQYISVIDIFFYIDLYTSQLYIIYKHFIYSYNFILQINIRTVLVYVSEY